MRHRTTAQPWQDEELVQRAQCMAAELHRHDVRKGTTIPYLSHLWAVACLVLEHGGDDQQVAAALLHDAVEDAGGIERLEEIRAVLGDEVARLVEALSDSVVDTRAGEVKAPWLERKTTYLGHLNSTDARVKLVSACDKLHNARAMLADYRSHRSVLWARFNEHDPARHLWYLHRLVAALSPPDVPPALADELRRTVDELSRLVTDDDPAVAGRLTELLDAPLPPDGG